MGADAAVPQVKSTTPQAAAYWAAAFNGGTIRRVSDARNRQLAKCVHNFVQKLGRTDEPSLLNLRQPVSKTIAFRPKPWKCRQTRSLRLAQDDAGTRRKSAGNLAKPLQICVLRTAGSRAQSREPRKLRDLPELSFVWYCSTLTLSPARSRPERSASAGVGAVLASWIEHVRCGKQAGRGGRHSHRGVLRDPDRVAIHAQVFGLSCLS